MDDLIRKLVTVFALSWLIGACSQSHDAASGLQLYALDCGSIEVQNMASFSIDGTFNEQSYSLVVPCFLIRHPDGNLLWDTGFDQSLFEIPDGLRGGGFHSTVSVRLTDQLSELGLAPTDIDYVSVSHSHPDHAGNLGLFEQSTFVVSVEEHAYMFSELARNNTAAFASYSAMEHASTLMFEDQYDLFGDGKVIMLTLPGHTPGSTVLQLRLENAGVILLTGDLITHAAGREVGAIPAFNTDAVATRISLEKFEVRVANENARVIIQHEPLDFEALPAFPAWLD